MPQENENQFDYVMATLPGIVVGCLLYYVGAAVVAAIYGLVLLNGKVSPEVWLLPIAAGFWLSLLMGASLGTFFLLAGTGINWSLGHVLSARTTATAAACATGYFPVALVASGFWVDERNMMAFVLAVLLGPVLAATTVALSSWRFEQTNVRTNMIYPAHQPNQFSIRTLMVLTAWAAVIVLIAKSINDESATIWAILAGYFMMLLAVLGLTRLLEKSREPASSAATE